MNELLSVKKLVEENEIGQTDSVYVCGIRARAINDKEKR